jgi:hypothetical protein
MTTFKPASPQLDSTFHPVEHAIIADWLGVERPECAREVNLDLEAAQEADGPNGVPYVRPRPAPYGEQFFLANAVARIVLAHVQGSLPQWALCREEEIVFSRKYDKPRRGPVSIAPRFLFEINWCDSGPGYSWPEAYHVATLPGYDVHVVTASQDGPGVYSYADVAIGHFSASERLLEGSRAVVTAWWRTQINPDPEYRWETLLRTGEVTASMAEAWADAVWAHSTAP